MRIPVPPPDFAAHGAALAHVARDACAANAASAPRVDVAQALAMASARASGHGDGEPAWLQLGGRISHALGDADAPADLPVLLTDSARATGLARLFAGEAACR